MSIQSGTLPNEASGPAFLPLWDYATQARSLVAEELGRHLLTPPSLPDELAAYLTNDAGGDDELLELSARFLEPISRNHLAQRCGLIRALLPRTRQIHRAGNRALFAFWVLTETPTLLPESAIHRWLVNLPWDDVDWDAVKEDCWKISNPTIGQLLAGRPVNGGQEKILDMYSGPEWKPCPWIWYHEQIAQDIDSHRVVSENDQDYKWLLNGWIYQVNPVLLEAVNEAFRWGDGALLKRLTSLLPAFALESIRGKQTKTQPEKIDEKVTATAGHVDERLASASPLDRERCTELLDPQAPSLLASLNMWDSAARTKPEALFLGMAEAVTSLAARGVSPNPQACWLDHFIHHASPRAHNQPIASASAWEMAFPYGGSNSAPFSHRLWQGTTEAGRCAMPLVRALASQQVHDHQPEMNFAQRQWAALALAWSLHGLSEEAAKAKKREILADIDGALARAGRDKTLIELARLDLLTLKEHARQGQGLPEWTALLVHDDLGSPKDPIAAALDVVAVGRHPFDALKTLLLILRELKVPAVPASLDATGGMEGEDGDRTWNRVSTLTYEFMHRFARHQGIAGELVQLLGEDLALRMKPLKPGSPPRPPRPDHLNGPYHDMMVEPSAIWRDGYVRAIGELALHDPRRPCAILEHVRAEDPDETVRQIAAEALSAIQQHRSRRGRMSYVRMLSNAWWRLRWTHRRSLGLTVDAGAAHRTRLQEAHELTQRH